MHQAEFLLWTICLPTLVVIAQAVFFLERGQTDKQTDRQPWLNALPYAGGYTAGVGNNILECTAIVFIGAIRTVVFAVARPCHDTLSVVTLVGVVRTRYNFINNALSAPTRRHLIAQCHRTVQIPTTDPVYASYLLTRCMLTLIVIHSPNQWCNRTKH